MNIRHSFATLSILYKMLIFYIVIIILCIMVMVSIISIQSTNAIRETAQNTAEQVMISSYRSMMSQINDINYVFTTLQANKNLQNPLSDTDEKNTVINMEKLEDILFEVDIYGKKFNNIELYALNHPEYKYISSDHVFSSDVIANYSSYEDILGSHTQPIWHNNDNNYAQNSNISAMKVLTSSYSHEPIGILRIEIDTTQFTEQIQNLKLANTGRLFISNSSAHIVNPYDDKFISMFYNNPDIHDLVEDNRINTVYSKINNVNYMITIYPLDNTGFHLIGAVPIDEFDTQVMALRDATVITTAVMVIIILLLLYYVSSFITKPIIRLSKHMELFTPDNPQIVTHSQEDEIAKLYNSFNNMQRRIVKLTLDLQDSLTIQKKAELKAIQSQISPHFLYNTLNSINNMAQKHKVNDIEFMTSSLATFFTKTLNNGNIYSTIGNEIVHIMSYMDIQNIRFSNKFEVNINVDENIKSCSILNLTLQPLVENCIVHAFKNKEGKCIISIDAVLENDDIYIYVKDNGLGANIVDIDKLNEYVNKPFSFDDKIDKYGIHNVNQRIKLYYGTGYGLSYRYNEPDGLIAIVHILKKEAEEI